MSARPTVFCSGVIFSVFPAGDRPSLPGPGVYMLCRRDLSGTRAILYIGETFSLAARLGPAHEHWAEALALGMNEVLVHLLAKTSAERLAVEARLRRLNPTPLNRQSRGAPPSLLGLGSLLREAPRLGSIRGGAAPAGRPVRSGLVTPGQSPRS